MKRFSSFFSTLVDLASIFVPLNRRLLKKKSDIIFHMFEIKKPKSNIPNDYIDKFFVTLHYGINQNKA